MNDDDSMISIKLNSSCRGTSYYLIIINFLLLVVVKST
jgi:hypothetical protein